MRFYYPEVGEEVHTEKVNIHVNNIIIGKPWMELVETMSATNKTTGDTVDIKFTSKTWK